MEAPVDMDALIGRVFSNALDEDIVGSPFSKVPVMTTIESRFSIDDAVLWVRHHLYLAVLSSVVYGALVYTGRNWMSNRKPYDLRRPLFLWNVSLAAFSIIGCCAVVPNILDRLFTRGLANSCCRTDATRDPAIGLWALLFALSKIYELGDTAFIILRKSPLSFLHWYHHITVLIYTWYGLGYASAIGHWFAAMNFFVHSCMYSYYAVKALGYRVPSNIALCITVLQILQMFGGLIVTVTAFTTKHGGEGSPCELNDGVFYMGMVIYSSYALLFLNFFYHRYLKPAKPVKKD